MNSIWQLIALIAILFGAIGGGLACQTTMIDKRFEQFDKRFEQLEKRLVQSEKNIIARFEDLKQEVRLRDK